jgi:hypothetical protein
MNRKITLIAVFLIAGITGSFAQQLASEDWSRYSSGTRYAGYLIYKDGKDTVKGWIQNQGPIENQERCIFYANQNDKKPVEKYNAENVKAYGFGDKHYHSMHYSGGLVSKPVRFLLLVKDGGISTNNWYETGKTPTVVYTKLNDPATEPHTQDYFMLKFASKMSEFVADNADLSKKIADKEKGYGVMKFFDIIDEYNKWYAAKK